MKILFIKEKRSPSGVEGIGTHLVEVCKRLNELKIPAIVALETQLDDRVKSAPLLADFINLKYYIS